MNPRSIYDGKFKEFMQVFERGVEALEEIATVTRQQFETDIDAKAKQNAATDKLTSMSDKFLKSGLLEMIFPGVDLTDLLDDNA